MDGHPDVTLDELDALLRGSTKLPALTKRDAVRPRSRSRHSADERERSLAQAVRALRSFYRGMGFSESSFRRGVLAGLADREPYRVREARRYSVWMVLADLLAAWHREARYLDASGLPRALPVEGRQGFAMLCRRFLRKESPADVAQFLVDCGVLRRDADGSVRPVRRTALIPALTAITLERIPVAIHGFLDTLAHNTQSARESEGRLERAITINDFPAKLVPAFDDWSRYLANGFVQQTDEWALRRRVARRQRGPKVRVTVHLVAHVEPQEKDKVA
jgi:hypothetical protein